MATNPCSACRRSEVTVFVEFCRGRTFHSQQSQVHPLVRREDIADEAAIQLQNTMHFLERIAQHADLANSIPGDDHIECVEREGKIVRRSNDAKRDG